METSENRKCKKDESGRLIGMNIDVEPIWKSPYFLYIKLGRRKKKKKKTILTSFLPSTLLLKEVSGKSNSAISKKLFKVRHFPLLLNIQRLLTGLNHKVQSPEYIMAQMDRGGSKWLQEHSVVNTVTVLPCVNLLKSHVPVYVEVVVL